jgi:CheY-like chemotaxis protein
MAVHPLPSRPIVLIVDDEAEVRRVLELGLKEFFDVETARSANEAEIMMGTRNYDVVVCDHLMEEEEGLAFLCRARTQFPKVQRILMTGYINPEILSRSQGLAGLAACLTKPVSPSEVIEAIRLAVHR